MSSKSALGKATRGITHRVLRCAQGLFAPTSILNLAQALQQAHHMALRPPLTPSTTPAGLQITPVPPCEGQGPPS